MNADESGESWVCTGCIGEAFLRSCIEKEGTRQTCHYCAEAHPCFSLEAVSDLTEKAIEAHFYRTPPEPNEMDGNDSNLLIVFYVQIMPDDFVMQLHRF
ncbi:Uncharacterised protein [Klebsiella pneumoniae]|nr:Uncharacterised protein [Klebsiella pneumoniae]